MPKPNWPIKRIIIILMRYSLISTEEKFPLIYCSAFAQKHELTTSWKHNWLCSFIYKFGVFLFQVSRLELKFDHLTQEVLCLLVFQELHVLVLNIWVKSSQFWGGVSTQCLVCWTVVLAISLEQEGQKRVLEVSAFQLKSYTLLRWVGKHDLWKSRDDFRRIFVCIVKIFNGCEELSFCNLSYAAHVTRDQLESRAHSIEEICPEL